MNSCTTCVHGNPCKKRNFTPPADKSVCRMYSYRNNTEPVVGKGMKLCVSCGKVLRLGEFYRCTTSSDGYTSRCKECSAEHDRGIRKQFGIGD